MCLWLEIVLDVDGAHKKAKPAKASALQNNVNILFGNSEMPLGAWDWKVLKSRLLFLLATNPYISFPELTEQGPVEQVKFIFPLIFARRLF